MKKLLWLLTLVMLWLPVDSYACQQYRNVLQDLNGNILPFGSVTVYKSGSTTAATLYADPLCSIIMVNPTNSVQDGTFTFFVGDGVYDLLFSYPGHTFTNVTALGLFEPVLENVVPVGKYLSTDICLPGTGALAQLAGQTVWLEINKPVTCGTATSAGSTITFLIVGAGSITETGGATLTINGAVVKRDKYTPISSQLPTVTPDCLLGTTFEIQPPNNSAFTINPPIHCWDGSKITFMINNNTGGALGTATWNTTSSGYKMRTWTQPAAGNIRAITFVYIAGYRWYEISRTEADVPY